MSRRSKELPENLSAMLKGNSQNKVPRCGILPTHVVAMPVSLTLTFLNQAADHSSILDCQVLCENKRSRLYETLVGDKSGVLIAASVSQVQSDLTLAEA